MDTDERLAALKIVYADIILNTAKDAAARIMLSERKALRFQQELQVAKEEGLQMLLRLKQLMDSRISEEEMTFFSQQRKIEELEAQLHEAEDIVTDLREELREVQAEPEKMKSKKQPYFDECDTSPPDKRLDEDKLNIFQSISLPLPESQHESITEMKISTLNQGVENHKSCSENCYCTGSSYVVNHDSPSILLRSKEPDPYSNGCSQRIHAFERNLLSGEFSLSGEIDDVKNETSVQENEASEGIFTRSTHMTGRACNIEKKVADADTSWYKIQAVTRYTKNMKPSWRPLPELFMEKDRAPDISYSKSLAGSVNSNGQAGRDTSNEAVKSSSDTTEMGTLSRCAVAESEAELVKACSVENTIDNDEAFIDKLVLRQENGTAESSEVLVHGADFEHNSVPFAELLSKQSVRTNEMSSRPVNDRSIKYTFQRKRKKEFLTNPDRNASFEKIILKRKAEERENGCLGPQKSGLKTESYRESQQPAQVAHQLISLSEKN